jgi:hypothetical protein
MTLVFADTNRFFFAKLTLALWALNYPQATKFLALS